ncbi:MAG TPA: hypothetical protein VFZ65_13540 [Planctomycetota bacterium]|nr:hypothetical protein [Planctomycetota bacterium]
MTQRSTAAAVLAQSMFLSMTLPAQTLIWPGEEIATIDATHLRAYVPAASADRLRTLVARADQIYAHMIEDAGFVEHDKLRLLIADWFDDHNGYSFVAPFPLVQIELAPSQPDSTIFAGGLDAERTLAHEFAHQISNDRNHGVRGVLESIFGRLLPNDLLSLLFWYVSTPAHQTMPRFWQEGLGVWAETSYADPTSAWAGRGRDPLTHMIWRLDTAADVLPDVSDWRITFHEWPFGGAAYTYGTAYTRFLEGYLGSRASVWRFVQVQAEMWPFLFDRGPRRLVGQRHAALLERARTALRQEQLQALATLRSAPVTTPKTRWTPADMLVGAPAWTAPDRLEFAGKPAQGRARLYTLQPNRTVDWLSGSNTPMLAFGAVRALPDGGSSTGIVYHEFNWRGISHIVVDGVSYGWRLLQPDAGPLRDGERTVVAVQLRDGGGQDLVVHRLRGGELDAGATLRVESTPWTPALRPGGGHDDELVWVETDAAGSRLVLGSLNDDGARTVLWSVRGRILHPAWSADGGSLFCCADHTGVANAYRVDLAGAKVDIVPVTNTIGGVVACVPSPDGKTLAIVDHDERGPFLALLPNDRASYAPKVPTIALAWPAPVTPELQQDNPAAQRPTPIAPLPAGAADALSVRPYSGLGELRPLFWAPSTVAVPEGGYGVYGLMADPLFTQVVQGGVGVGYVEQEAVAFASWDHLGSVVEYGINGGRSERTFAETVRRGGELFDYTETVARGEVRVGRGLYALERTFLVYGSFGVESHDEVDHSARDYAGGTYVKAPFRDTERYAELTFGYDDSTFYPTSYTREDGFRVLGVYRHSGLGGDLERNLALGDAGYTWSLFPKAGHQLVVRGQIGWSDGDDTLQGNFSVGGGLSTGLPRGYIDSAVATGRYLLGGSLAYRFPLWRPFTASGTTPFRGRQLVVELFGDTANVSNDRLNGDGQWFTSVGGELFANAEFFDGILSPGVGVAFQLDGQRDVKAYFTLGFSF